MGNFFVVIPSGGLQREAKSLFRSGLDIASKVQLPAPSRTIETEWVYAASFPRQNGSGTPIVSDPRTGSWLFAIGSWFHVEDFAAGAESRLLARYLEIGADRLAQELEGFFVIFVGDARTRETIVLTDIVGSCHGFIRSCDHGLVLSGSSLLLAGLGDFQLDPVGCQEFLHAGIIYEDRTVYREVRKLAPASLIRFADGVQRSEERYWRITDLAPESLDGENAAAALWESLLRAARKVRSVFVRPICDLTGGYDSRAVVAAFLDAGVQFSTVVSGPAESPDVVVSRGLAQRAGLPHTHMAPQERISFDQVKAALQFTDGEYDLVEYARILRIHRALSERFDISINGSFGEVARGYWWELLFPHTGARRELDAQKVARLRYAVGRFDPPLFPSQTRLDLVSHLAAVIERTNHGLFKLPNTLQMDHTYLILRMQRWQGRIASSTNRLWPCLSPFLFRSVLETMLQAKARTRQRSLLTRKMLAAFQPRLAEFPLERGYPAVVATWKTLHRFWPLPQYYAKRALSKIARLAGSSPSSPSPRPHEPARLQLWRDDTVRELMHPATMRLGCVLDPTALGDFLVRSQDRNFPFNDLWTRVLSLEYTLQVLESLGAKPRA